MLRRTHDVVQCNPAESHVLIELDTQGSLTGQELAVRLRTDKSTVSRAISSLGRLGLLQTSRDVNDRRRKIHTLTIPGQKAVHEINDHANTMVKTALALLPHGTPTEVLQALESYGSALQRARFVLSCTIRPIIVEDDMTLSRVLTSVREEMGLPPHLQLESMERSLSSMYAGDKSHYWVVEHDRRLIGGAGIAPLFGGNPETCELQKMYLDASSRGNGLGRYLVHHCLDQAIEDGFTQCYLETRANMSAARSLYERLGFRQLEAPLGDTGHCGHCDIWYARDLV